jgi:murein L,D-transpeptidase YafK
MARALALLGYVAALPAVIPPARADEAAASKPIPAATAAVLKAKSVTAASPIYIRIFKEESELEIWKARADGRYVPVETFPICNWSGTLGPKQAIGDHMAPEGFYSLTRDSLKPDSKYHLALNVGYPNALDRSLGRSGDFIMVHGKCVSVGCFAMTDDLIEEVYAYVREAMDGGQESVPLHIFPFRMSAENLVQHASHSAIESWVPLKQAYDDFSESREPPRIAACSRRYVVNPIAPVEWNPEAECPAQLGKLIAPLSPRLNKRLKAIGAPIMADGPKTRTSDDIATWRDAGAKADMAAVASREEARRERKAAAGQEVDNGGMTPLLAREGIN